MNTSKPEKLILSWLEDWYDKENIEYQYYSSEYPFSCDFYVKPLDLYIEYNGSWTHGGWPYIKEDDEYFSIELAKKAETSKYYNNALSVWTVHDPLKRQTALINKLNYLY